jgi:hypothetical protein
MIRYLAIEILNTILLRISLIIKSLIKNWRYVSTILVPYLTLEKGEGQLVPPKR